ncbi:MAG: hypothetical protein AMJ53_03100 [Gammaproteobacteria bacterium SG8_11]|nr:MAG: hypothetical protein AMJ53_03100 [Gammaproteobacteria bacterium SG8_11]
MSHNDIPKNPNPQGKGLVPVLDSLAASRPAINVPPKFIEQISSELFTSLFVLESQFHFKPVVGKPYWLYRQGQVFKLSLISPTEWRGGFGQFVGECQLQSDITWTLILDEQAASDSELMQLIANKRRELDTQLRAADTLEEVLPVFRASLPFYQRVFASALAHSLGVSMQKSGIKQLSYRQAQKLLDCDSSD